MSDKEIQVDVPDNSPRDNAENIAKNIEENSSEHKKSSKGNSCDNERNDGNMSLNDSTSVKPGAKQERCTKKIVAIAGGSRSTQLVHLNVGGVIYITTMSTLAKYPNSMLGAMFASDLEPTLKDENGRYFIDRDGLMFKHVLNFMRSGQLSLPEEFGSYSQLRVEADYYQIAPLVEAIEYAYSEYLNAKNKRKDHESGDFIEIRETHYGRSKDYREQMERVHMIFIGKWCYINEFRVFLQSSRLADGTEGLPGVQCMIYGDYCEMSWTSEEQYFRIKLGDYLSRMTWKLVESSATASACEYYNYRTNTKVDGAIQKIFRDKWFKPHTKQ